MSDLQGAAGGLIARDAAGAGLRAPVLGSTERGAGAKHDDLDVVDGRAGGSPPRAPPRRRSGSGGANTAALARASVRVRSGRAGMALILTENPLVQPRRLAEPLQQLGGKFEARLSAGSERVTRSFSGPSSRNSRVPLLDHAHERRRIHARALLEQHAAALRAEIQAAHPERARAAACSRAMRSRFCAAGGSAPKRSMQLGGHLLQRRIASAAAMRL